MGITIIIKEGSADRRRRIYERPNPFNGPIEGRTKSVDEAHDIDYHRHGEGERPYVVEGDVPEMKQANRDQMLRVAELSGRDIDPDENYRHWQKEEAERKK